MVSNEDNAVAPVDLKEVKRHVGTLVANGQAADAIPVLFEVIDALTHQIGGLSDRVMSLLKQAYGPRSEKVDPNQLTLLLDQLTAEVKATANAPVPRPKTQAARPVRRPLPADLPREVDERNPPAEDLVCEECGQAKVKIGSEVSELLEYEPARFKVVVVVRNKFACSACESGVVIAPSAEKVIEKGIPGPGLLTQLVVSKYRDHLPLNRQMEIFSRLGVDLSSSTLSDWVGATADTFAVVYREMVKQVLAAHVLGTDDTGLRVLDRDHERGVKLGHLWAYVADGRLVVFDYTSDRKASGPASFLVKRSGIIQCDGYAGYERIVRDHAGDVVRAGCLAHVRRKFVDALEAGNTAAAIPVALIRDLYRVEEDSREAGESFDARLERRREEAVPILKKLDAWIRVVLPNTPPKCQLGKALHYAKNQWDSLQVYLTDGQVPIDNNGVEREIRRVAVGRKNWLFAGSDEGGRRAAILYSILGTCALVGADPYLYVRDVLDKIIHGWPNRRVRELLPDAWVAERERAAAADISTTATV